MPSSSISNPPSSPPPLPPHSAPPSQSESNIRIAVRVRPFNDRELARNARCCVSMDGSVTTVHDPDASGGDKGGQGKAHSFGFDYSYWSHDGYVDKGGEMAPAGPKSHFADQRRVFADLGTSLLDAAEAGFNATLMAYGQTGSGKSYTMFGYGANKGLIPLFCEELFRRFGGEDAARECHVLMSFLEIYNERVKDLLSPTPVSLKVRQSPSTGFYVEGLRSVPVTTYRDVSHLIDLGTKMRSVAATKMNESSSRAHAIITLRVQQVDKTTKAEKVSTVHLVDLAGSERVSDTGLDQKDRLREAGNINSSLSVLGNVIAALVAVQRGKKDKDAIIPYRDSVLTKLLQNSLGGNSKTIMVGAVSPADSAYDETVSTLRFLDRAKAIKTVAVVNENPTDRLIRELRTENERLKALLSEREVLVGGSGGNGGVLDDVQRETLAKLQSKISEKERDVRMLQEANKSWEQRLEEAKADFDSRKTDDDLLEEKKLSVPNLKNINEDPLLSGMLYYFVETGKHLIGRAAKGSKADIQLNGLSILPEHAVVTNSGNKSLTIKPSSSGARIRVNGILLTDTEQPVTLQHNDRVLIGTQHLYLVKLPHVADRPTHEPTWSDAQAEIAQGQGFGKAGAGDSAELRGLYDYIVEFLPLVNEANAVSEDLGRSKRFELTILGDEAGGKEGGGAEAGKDKTYDVVVRVSDTENGFKWIWTKERFRSTAYRIQDLYQRYLEDGPDMLTKLPISEDPLNLLPEDYLIGLSAIPLKTLLTLRELHPSVIVRDYKGSNQGILKVSLSLSGKNLLPAKDDDDGSAGDELIGKAVTVHVKIENILGLRWTRGGIKCRFRFGINDPEVLRATSTVASDRASTPARTISLFRTLLTSSTLDSAFYHTTRTLPSSANPNFDDAFEAAVKKMSKEQMEYLRDECLYVEVWGDHSTAAREPTTRTRAGTAASMSPRAATRELASPTRPSTGDTTTSDMLADLNAEPSKMKAELVVKARLIADLTAKNFNLNTTVVSLNSEIARLRQELVFSKKEATRLRAAALPPSSLFACLTSDGRTVEALRSQVVELERAKSTVEEEVVRLRGDTSFLIARDEVVGRLDALGKLVREIQNPPASPERGQRRDSSPAGGTGAGKPKHLGTTHEDPLETEPLGDVPVTRVASKPKKRSHKVEPEL